MKEIGAKVVQFEIELNNLMKIFEFSGLQHFSLKNLSEEMSKKPSALRTVIISTVTSILAILFLKSLTDVALDTEKVTIKNILMYGSKNFLTISVTFTLFVAIVASFRTTNLNKQIFQNFKEIATISHESFGVNLDFKSFKASQISKLLLFISSLAILHGILVVSISNNQIEALAVSLAVIPFLFLILISYKTVFYVSLINFTLKHLLHIVVEMFHHHPVKIAENINYHLTTVKSKDDPILSLRYSRRIFNLTFHCAELFNKCNGLTFLAIISLMATSSTLSGYDMFIYITKKLPIEDFISKRHL